MNSSPPVPILLQPYLLNSNIAPLPSLQSITEVILLAIIPTARNKQEWPISFISLFHSIPGRPFPFVKAYHLLCMGRRCNLYKWLAPETWHSAPIKFQKWPGIGRQFGQSALVAGKQIQGRVSYTWSEDAFKISKQNRLASFFFMNSPPLNSN